jgi:hypothetical protein
MLPPDAKEKLLPPGRHGAEMRTAWFLNFPKR